MNFEFFLLILASVGALGGLVNCVLNGGFHLPNQKDGIWNPGWIGTTFVGIVTALVVSLGSPPFSTMVVTRVPPMPEVHLSYFVTALIAAIGGSKILLMLVERKADEVSKKHMEVAINNLAPAAPPRTDISPAASAALSDGKSQPFANKTGEQLAEMSESELAGELQTAMAWAANQRPAESAAAYIYVRQVTEAIKAKQPPPK